MKRAVFLASIIATLAMVTPASAVVVLDFKTGDAGTSGGVTVVSATNLSGSGIAIDTLTVSGDGAFDGDYDVTGTVNGSTENGVGNLSFSTSANTITIVGGVTCQAVFGVCASVGQVLAAPGTILLQGTGAFSNVAVTSVQTNNTPFTVSFNAPDTKDPTLLSALGITDNRWNLAAIVIAAGTGNAFPVTSSDITNTQVPEPTSVLLLGTILFAVTYLIRRRATKA